MNLTEAFRALDALNEDTFSVSDNGIEKLSEFEQNDDLTDDIPVIDPEADTEEDLSDSYIGKVILDCSVCHSKLYKDASEVNIDEEGQLANVGEECPYCYTSEGFKVVGEVAEYQEEPAQEESEVKESDGEETDEETNKSLEESLNEGPVATLDRPMSKLSGTLGNVLTNHAAEVRNIRSKEDALTLLDIIEDEVSDKSYLEEVKASIAAMPSFKVVEYLYNIILAGDGMRSSRKRRHAEESLSEAYEDVDGIMGEKGTKWTDDQLKKYFEAEKDNDPVLKAYNGNADKWMQDTLKGMKKVNESVKVNGENLSYAVINPDGTYAGAPCISEEEARELAAQKEGRVVVKLEAVKNESKSIKEAAFSGGVASNGSVDRYARPGGHTSKATFDKLDGKKTKTVKAKDLKPGMVTDTGKITQVKDAGWCNGEPSVEVSYGGVGNGGSYAADIVAADRDYQVLDESKSIKESVNNVNVETDDSIVNVSTDDNGKVTVTTEPNESPAEAGDEIIAPVSPETQAEIEETNIPEATEDTEELDLDVEEFDEESFDDLGESYLRNIYENVDSYKTTDVASTKNKIQVEGIIKFNSGNEKKTSFIFEAKDCNRKGKVRFIGENSQITRGKKAFTIAGSLNEGKFITESFRYNYKVKDDEGKSTRVYGTVRK